MRITNYLHLTENHRCAIYRDFALSPSEIKILHYLYQPMIGALAVSTYMTLHQQIPAEHVGFSRMEQHRKLFMLQRIVPNEAGRQSWIDATSAIEAVGLMHTYRYELLDRDETVYVYRLHAPLSIYDFFRTQHLALLLRDRVGKRTVNALKKELREERPQELVDFDDDAESISVPFYELFELNPNDVEEELAPSSSLLDRETPVLATEDDFTFEQIITRFPRDSYNRTFVEQLRTKPDQIAIINYIAKKYRLPLQDTCRLLDEDHIFTKQGMVDEDELQRKAYMFYRQAVKLEEKRNQIVTKGDQREQVSIGPEQEKAVAESDYVPVPEMLKAKCNIHQYNMMLRNEPYTKVLQHFFPGSVPGHILDIFAKVDLNYKLSEEVINVFIHYLITYQLSWNKPFIDSVVSDLLGKQVDSYEKAVQYIRDRTKVVASRNKANSGSKPSGRTRNVQQRPKLPIATGNEEVEAAPISEEEYECVLRMMQQYEREGE